LIRAFYLAALISIALPVCAQTPAEALRVEMVFWESIRASQDPADFRAYLKQYPQGTFAELARNRLAALERATVPAAAAQPDPLPQPGDTWTYRLYEPLRVDGPKERSYVARVTAASHAGIVEQYAIDGGAPVQKKHIGERQVESLGKSLFAPYLLQFGSMPAGSLGRLKVLDCDSTYICQASARIIGREPVRVPAGSFNAVKVEVQENWRGAMTAGYQTSQMTGGRILTVWYAQEVKRAVKFSSRTTLSSNAPIDTDFDLELVSYQLK
jgi:hypothetical protein